MVSGMKIKQSLRVASVFALCATALAWRGQDAPAQEDASSQPPVTVIAVRHAEKGADDPRDPGLTEEGTQRAAALAKLLSHAGVTHLFSTAYRRTQATVAPLATQLELEVEEYNPRDLAGFSKELKALPPGSVAVVSGHSNTTPGLVVALGGAPEGVKEGRGGPVLGEDEYDRLFLVTSPKGEGAVSLVELRYGE